MSEALSILVVDDDVEIQNTLRELLAEEGYAVTIAANGRDALERLRGGEHPSVILLDLMMPVMDGWQFRQEQRRDPALSGIPVIVITASGPAARETIDVDVFMTKPIKLQDLLGAIRAQAHQ